MAQDEAILHGWLREQPTHYTFLPPTQPRRDHPPFPMVFFGPLFCSISCQYIARTLQYPNQLEGDTATRKPRRLKQRPQSSEPGTSWAHKNEQPNSQSQVFARLQLTTLSFVQNSSLHTSNLGFCFWELYLLHIVIFLESLKSLCKCVGDSSWHLSKFWKRWQTD